MRQYARVMTFGLVVVAWLACTGCSRTLNEIEPKLSCQISPSSIARLPSPAPPLSHEEKASDWGKEYEMGASFAKEGDFYRAITCFKRAQFFALSKQVDLKHWQYLDWGVFLSYMLGGKYREALDSFESSLLLEDPKSFPAYHDLQALLVEALAETRKKRSKEGKRTGKASLPAIIPALEQEDPEYGRKVRYFFYLSHARLNDLETYLAEQSEPNPDATTRAIKRFCEDFRVHRKSPTAAGLYNALLPGAGYLYVGQVQSAVTSLLLNVLFVAASWRFFEKGDTAAGIITAGFEAGWYVGGITGARLAAKQYNDTYYNQRASQLMTEQRIFPLLMLHYAF